MEDYAVDLNCDMGESFGVYRIGNDRAVLPFVSSVNIACGFHAGDPSVMRATVKLALESKVAIGAHPGLPDLAGFGRRTMAVSPEEAHDLIIYQLGALSAFVESEGGKMHHVKPHGALYNMAAANAPLAEAIAEAIYKFNPELILYGLAGSQLIVAAAKRGLRSASEVFADRTYQPDGSLTSRNLPNAFIVSPKEAVEQVIGMVKEGKVISLDGTILSVKADTICIHGDSENTPAFVKQLHNSLVDEKIKIKAI